MKISGIIELRNLSMVTVSSSEDHLGLASAVLERFADENINLEYITEGSGKETCIVMGFCINVDDSDAAMDIVKDLHDRRVINSYQCVGNVGFIGIYGPHFREKPGLAYRLCHALSLIGINILGISSSISTVSCIIREEDMARAREGLLEYFDPS